MRSAQQGFTLAELLIALALLGVIASFTVPKVLQSTASSEGKAKVQEAAATLEQAWYDVKTSGAINSNGDLYDNLAARLNVLDGAADNTNNPLLAETNHPCINNAPATMRNGWVQFANGVVVSGLASGGANMTTTVTNSVPNYTICIDYNGAKAPNIPGSDVFIGNFNQWADWDVAGAGTASETAKNFRWGNANTGILTTAGAAITLGNGSGSAANSDQLKEARAGVYLTKTSTN